MVDVVVTGVGLWTALGSDVKSNWLALLAGKSAIALRQPFLSLPVMPLAMLDKRPADPEDIAKGVVKAALADAGYRPPLENCSVVVGSSRSYLNRWEAMMRGEESLENWLTALPCALSHQIAHVVGSQGPVLAPMAACATGIWALFHGYMLLQSERCSRVVVVAVDATVTPLTLTGFRRMGAMAKEGCYPFDCDRTGLVLGEGAAAVVLETRKAKTKNIYGQILGFGLSNDAYHVSSSRPDGALSVAQQCLQRSGLHPGDIDYVHAHGTGTRLNDANEAYMIEQLLPQAAVSSTKGATGHTLGAAGLVGTVFSLLSLKNQCVPPCVGLKKSEFAINLIQGEAKQIAVNRVLSSSFGFGGQNAVVAIARNS
ncbi:MAG: beta-ketoacyl-ACP synthase [Cyanobacteria bacterium P01_D01_bin.156]